MYIRSRSRLVVALLCTGLPACGGGKNTSPSSAPPPTNVASILVSGGPNNNYANGLFTSVTICAPGTANCQTVDNVLVDTGSFGLRILSSALAPLNSSLHQQAAADGNPVFECAQFVDSVLWGPVKLADIEFAGATASSLPIEIVDGSTVPLPSGCKAIGPAEEDEASLGANGILGLGFFVSDCGDACSVSTSSNPGFYYSCTGSSCAVISEPANQQVQNPVSAFTTNNNGIVIDLPLLSSSAMSLSGSVTLGIDTASNNNIGSARILTPDANGNLKTTFKAKDYSGFFDTGSNAYFFLDSATTGITECSPSNGGFYCPSSPTNLSAVNTSAQGGANNTVNFTIANASQLFSSNNFVFPSLGGPNPDTFDWGLPFFIGRKVFVALEGHMTSSGAGPFWAY